MAFGRDIDLKIGATDKTGTAFKSTESKMKHMTGMAKSMAGALGAALGVRAMLGAVRSAIDYGSALTDAAIGARVTVEAYQVLKYAAQEAGTGMDKVTMTLAKIQKATNDAINGLTTYTRAFDALGINLKTFQKLSPDEQFVELGRAMVKSKDQAVAYASILDIIGSRNAPKLMEVLKRLGTEGYKKVADEADKAGQVMDDVDTQTLDAAADAIARLKTAMTIKTGEVVAFWINVFDGIENDTEKVKLLRTAVEDLKESLKKIFEIPVPKFFSERFGKDLESIKKKSGLLVATKETGRVMSAVDARVLDVAAPTAPVAPAAPAGSGFAMMGGKTVTFGPEGEKLLAEQMARTAKLNEELAAKIKESNDAAANIISQIKINRN